MKEIELKLLEVDKKALSSKLRKLGAEKVFDGKLYALMFDYPDIRLRKSGILIRLRMSGKETCLTMKRKIPMEGVKAAEENELVVSDFKATELLLKSIGLVVTGSVRKRRESYSLGNAIYEFDTIPGIPTYMEIETKDIRHMPRAFRNIGLKIEDAKPWSTRQVLEYYRKISPSASRREASP
jgi:adenylate cyclase, class 2